MMGQIQAEESMVYTNDTETNGSLEVEKHGGDERGEDGSGIGIKSFLWHGGSAWDAWFSCASNQVHTNSYPPKIQTHSYIRTLHINMCVCI